MSIHISQIISQILAFLVMVWVLTKFGWKPLLSIMDERKKLIQSEFDAIAEQKKLVASLASDYREKLKNIETEARHKIQEAVRQANTVAEEIRHDAQVRAKEIMDRSQEEIRREMHAAKIELKNEVVTAAILTTEKILKKKLGCEEQRRLMEDFVKQVEL